MSILWHFMVRMHGKRYANRYLLRRLSWREIWNRFLSVKKVNEKLQDPPSETKELPEVKEAAPSKEKDDKKKDKDEKEAKEPKEKTTEKKGKDEEKEKKEPEPNFEILQNPARVLRQQLKVIQLVEGSHYVPVKDIQIGGIVMVKHIQTDTEEELVEPVAGEWSIPNLFVKESKKYFWGILEFRNFAILRE